MSQENVETVRRGVDAFDRRDKEAWLDTFARDAVMIPAREWPENAPIRGADAIWDFYVEVNAAWEEDPYELGEVIEARDDAVIANARREARGKASGAGVTFSYWVVLTFRHGKAIRVEWFTNRTEALEAAGLRE